MSDEQPTSNAPSFAEDITDEVFRLLAERHPELVPIEELVRELTFPTRPEKSSPAMFVYEAVDRLYHLGLAYRIEGFAFASRAGVKAVELAT